MGIQELIKKAFEAGNMCYGHTYRYKEFLKEHEAEIKAARKMDFEAGERYMDALCRSDKTRKDFETYYTQQNS